MRLLILALLPAFMGPVAAQPFAEPVTACLEEEARSFDFWLGNWSVANQQRPPGSGDEAPWFPTGTFNSRVYPILDGCAIVEESEGTLAWSAIHGFSIRVYDEARGEWTALMNWANAVKPNPSFTPLAGTADSRQALLHHRGISPQGQPTLNRVIFSDFTPTSFHWTIGASLDEGETWRSSWVMDAERVETLPDSLVCAGASVGPPSDPFCAQPDHRSTDFLLGQWAGTFRQGSLVRPITVEAYPFLGGCAIMESVKIGDGPDTMKQFRVRAFDEATGRWVLYAVSKETPELIRYEGSADDGRFTLNRVEPGLHETLTRSGPTLRWTSSAATQGAAWTEVASAELQRVE